MHSLQGLFDIGLLAELRAVMRQAALELGQWDEKSDLRDPHFDLVAALNAGRERARKAALEDAAREGAKASPHG